MSKAIYPIYLNTPFKAVMAESDDLIVVITSFAIGMVISLPLAFILGAGMVVIYRRAKKGKPRGFLQHLPYALGLKTFQGFDDLFHTEYGE
jgi:type IV conjugative transfer system protein TraL